jgi:hypothetical protein
LADGESKAQALKYETGRDHRKKSAFVKHTFSWNFGDPTSTSPPAKAQCDIGFRACLAMIER